MSRDANPDALLLHAVADATRLAILRELMGHGRQASAP
jgi:DNA-binding transcriptional ArsR family regulator